MPGTYCVGGEQVCALNYMQMPALIPLVIVFDACHRCVDGRSVLRRNACPGGVPRWSIWVLVRAVRHAVLGAVLTGLRVSGR
jgi:hypothetical protein